MENLNLALKSAVAVASIGTACYISYSVNRLLSMQNCCEDIQPKHTREKIEQIVNAINTPLEAFVYLSKNVEFFVGHDQAVNKCPDKWSSLQETLAMGSGDCEDGAIAFLALLSDNKQYDGKLVFLKNNDKELAHVIAVYSEGKKWGIASFNNVTSDKKTAAQFTFPIYNSIEEAIHTFKQNYDSYAIFDFSADKLKFGKCLKNKVYSLAFKDIKR